MAAWSERAARGDGPVDAAFMALKAATGVQVTLRQFEVRAVSGGQDAQGEAVVQVEYANRNYRGASAVPISWKRARAPCSKSSTASSTPVATPP